MRASRLIKMVLLLQTRREMTAAELAEELEVSERTVARDVLALSEAGVPVYADRGRAGGYRLVGGYRTRLTGIGRGEAEALFLSGVPSALRDMGLADAASAARLKVSAALLPELSDAQDTAAQRFHLDAPGWWNEPERPALLPTLAEAVWDDRVVTARYRRDGGEVERELEPYGLVLKAGVWYVAARVVDRARGAGPGHGADREARQKADGAGWRVYRVDRFRAVALSGERFARDREFDLPEFWADRAASFARSILRDEVTLRLTEAGARMLRHVTDRVAADEALAKAGHGPGRPAGPEDAGDSVTVTLPVESLDVAFSQLLSLGPECEVLEPERLRARFGSASARMAALYAPSPSPSSPSPSPSPSNG
ncbi:helix-turn-helix transcriptional regulator [Streptomyces sp. NPDC054796]